MRRAKRLELARGPGALGILESVATVLIMLWLLAISLVMNPYGGSYSCYPRKKGTLRPLALVGCGFLRKRPWGLQPDPGMLYSVVFLQIESHGRCLPFQLHPK